MLRVFNFLLLLALPCGLNAQYISRSEPVPYSCPVVCASGTLTLKIPQIQNLPAGSQIQAVLSNASGSFATGTQILPASQFSTNQGATWQNGPYMYAGNINDLFIRVIIPAGTPAGTGYTIKIQASTGYVSNDFFQCSSSNSITVTTFETPLPAVAENAQGYGNWIGHVYTWNPTTGNTLNTPALVAQQSFFSPPNYQGHVVVNPLSFDVNFTSGGGVPGTWNNGTSMSCGNSLSQNFSIRLRREENFSPGFYTLSIQGDDGIRLSIDGGLTWILDSFIEQQYAASFKTTATLNPNGICLSGPTDLVIEYFQRPADARMTFTVTQVSGGTVSDPVDLSLCENQGGIMTVGAASAGSTYQWQLSTDGGANFSNISDNVVYSGTATSTLTFTNVPSNFNGYLYRCLISSACGQNVAGNSAEILVQSAPSITAQPQDAAWCNGQTLSFSASAEGNGLTYQWQVSTNGGASFSNIPMGSPYSGVNSNVLTLVSPPANLVGNMYQLIVSGCGTQVLSQMAELLPGGEITITQQPIPLTVCQGENASFSVSATGGTSYQWQVNSGSGFNNVNDNNGYSGSQTPTLNLVGAATSINGLAYRCEISGGCSADVLSLEVVLTVNPNTSITNQPDDLIVCEGENASFTINASGSSLTYQWQISTDGGASFSNIPDASPYSGSTTTSLSINTPENSFSGNIFRCLVDGVCGNIQNSQEALLTISESPQVLAQPQSVSACEGETVSFEAGFTGDATIIWQMSTDGGATFQNLSNGNGFNGVNTPQLSVGNLNTGMTNYVFMATASACNTEISSNPATLEVLPLPRVELLQNIPLVCPGEDLEIDMQVQHALTISWEINTGNGWQPIQATTVFSGVNTATLTLNNIPADLQNALFRCIVEGVCGSPAISEEVLLYLKGIPVLLDSPMNTVACSGGAVNFRVIAQGEGIEYQWQRMLPDGSFADLQDEGFFSGSVTPVLQAEAVSELNNLVVRCVLSGCGDVIESDTARMVIFQNDPVYIPNSFTPGNDQVNEVFKVYTFGEPDLDASIYNRWGELLYSWTNKDDGWDGRYLNTEVQEGIYVYRIKINTQCEQKTIQGAFHLIR